MNLKYIAFFSIMMAVITIAATLPMHAAQYFNGPTVSELGSTTAKLSLSAPVLETLSAEEETQVYFEYFETQQVCIMIYPTPEHCLPKKTPKGQTEVLITGLKSATSYTVSYKKDNTIVCITTPCPSNAIESVSMEFITQGGTVTFNRNLMYRSRGPDVTALQDILRAQGYLNVQSTGFFGIATFRAVKAFQKNYMKIPPTGFVGPKTRAVLLTIVVPNTSEERFEGTIQFVSTGCFSDGECSVTIDGKKVVTTVGWSRDIVGSIRGTALSIGDIETNKIGARAKVYAKKTTDGYTLYGNANYYIEVL